MTKQSISSLL